MKQETRKSISRLSNYIGQVIIRINPTVSGDRSYTDEPILFIGFTADGRIKYQHIGVMGRIFEWQVMALPIEFTDRNWLICKKALKPDESISLNKFIGKKIRRIRPTPIIGDRSYMCEFDWDEPPTLVSANKYHMVIRHNDVCLEGEQSILGSDFCNPEDWVLVEEENLT